MGKVLKLMDMFFEASSLRYVIAVILMGLGGVTILTWMPSISTYVLSEGFLNVYLNSVVSGTLIPVSVFLIIPATVIFESLSDRRKGLLVALTPTTRMDLLKTAYLTSLILGFVASLTVIAIWYFVNVAVLPYVIPISKLMIVVSLTAILFTVPMLIFVTSLTAILFSVTPIKSGITWVMAVIYLIAVPFSVALLRFNGYGVAAEYVASVFAPSHGLIAALSGFLGIKLPSDYLVLDPTTYLGVSLTSIAVSTALAVSLFKTYAEVSV